MERRGFIGGLIAGLFGATISKAEEEQKTVSMTIPPLEEGEYIVRFDDKGLVSCERIEFDPHCFDVTTLEDLYGNEWKTVGDKLTVYGENGKPILEKSVLSNKQQV